MSIKSGTAAQTPETPLGGVSIVQCEGTDALRHAIGGMIAHVGDSFALFAPNANSYRRFKANSYAPVAPTWGDSR